MTPIKIKKLWNDHFIWKTICEVCGQEKFTRTNSVKHVARKCKLCGSHRGPQCKDKLKFLMDRIRVLDTGCWLWTNSLATNGYGRIVWERKQAYAHRIAWELLKHTRLSATDYLDHICRNRGCVNPDHLRLVSFKENILAGVGPSAVNARKTHCVHGHALEGSNLIHRTDGGRRCRECKKRCRNERYKRIGK